MAVSLTSGLGTDVQNHIFGFLDVPSVIASAGVNKLWHEIESRKPIWKTIVYRTLPPSTPEAISEANENSKLWYRDRYKGKIYQVRTIEAPGIPPHQSIKKMSLLGERLYIAGRREKGSILTVYDIKAMKVLQALPIAMDVIHSISVADHLVAVGGFNHVRIIDLRDPKILHTRACPLQINKCSGASSHRASCGEIVSLAFNGRLLATGIRCSNDIEIWDAHTNAHLKSIQSAHNANFINDIFSEPLTFLGPILFQIKTIEEQIRLPYKWDTRTDEGNTRKELLATSPYPHHRVNAMERVTSKEKNKLEFRDLTVSYKQVWREILSKLEEIVPSSGRSSCADITQALQRMRSQNQRDLVLTAEIYSLSLSEAIAAIKTHLAVETPEAKKETGS